MMFFFATDLKGLGSAGANGQARVGRGDARVSGDTPSNPGLDSHSVLLRR